MYMSIMQIIRAKHLSASHIIQVFQTLHLTSAGGPDHSSEFRSLNLKDSFQTSCLRN